MAGLTVLAEASSSPLFDEPPEPFGVIEAADRSIWFCCVSNHRIFRLDGEAGSSLDPTEACLNRPHGVFVDFAGAILIGDSDNRRLLRLSL